MDRPGSARTGGLVKRNVSCWVLTRGDGKLPGKGHSHTWFVDCVGCNGVAVAPQERVDGPPAPAAAHHLSLKCGQGSGRLQRPSSAHSRASSCAAALTCMQTLRTAVPVELRHRSRAGWPAHLRGRGWRQRAARWPRRAWASAQHAWASARRAWGSPRGAGASCQGTPPAGCTAWGWRCGGPRAPSSRTPARGPSESGTRAS